MHIFLTVLAAIGWTLLGLLAVLLLALLLPVRVAAELREGKLSLTVYLLFFLRVRLLPLPEKKRAPRPSAPKKAKPPQPDAKERNRATEKKLRLSFDFVCDLVSAAGVFMRRVLRALHFRRIVLILPVHRDDAAETAIACGRMQAAVGAGAALLENFLDLRFDCVHILPDFTDDIEAGPYLSGEVVSFPILFVIAGLFALGRFAGRRLKKEA